MRIRLTLHHLTESLTLFDGLARECLPLPRPGDLFQIDGKQLRIEGVQYIQRGQGFCEVQLLA